MTESNLPLVPAQMMGELWPAGQPGTDPVMYGHADIEPKGAFEARSYQTFRLTYTVGRYGLDDTGAIRVLFRAMSDAGRLQTTDPTASNYVTATSSSGVPLNVDYSHHGVAPRPRWKCLTVRVSGGFLREGDRIVIVFGDTAGGGPGMTLQTFVEAAFEFKVAADVCAVGHFIPIPDTPAISVVPGPPAVWRAVLPSLRRPGERFQLGLKAEDKWGNPTDLAEGEFTFETTLPVNGLPPRCRYAKGQKSMSFWPLTVDQPGVLRVTVREGKGAAVAESHPLVLRDGKHGGYWGDIHGQSGESIGVTTAREYFDFARNMSFLDVSSHQANDFQVNNAFWAHINELTAAHQEDGRFVTFPGYEWSGNTAVGGDRNVFFRTEGRQIHRSSHALLEDRSDIGTDAPTANALFEALADEDCVICAHVGGRYADIKYAHDPKLETAMEIHSAWGTFEWLLTDGFPLGHRSGVVCNSDGHKGRPGASYPGASTFGAYGGLTCFLTDELTRDGIFDALRRRHHYGTTGTRLHLDVRAAFTSKGRLFERDPNVFADTASSEVGEVMMGDIAQTADDRVTLRVEATTQTPIERIEIRNGTQVLATLRGYAAGDLGERVRVLWSGAEYRGRGRDTNWKGSARFTGATIRRIGKINAWNHERLLERRGSDSVVWDSITTGNFGGFDAWIDGGERLEISTNLGDLSLSLADIGLDDVVMEAGGLARQLRTYRLPERMTNRELTAEMEIALKPQGDNPLWVCLTTEDGFQAWSSPIYLFR